MANIADKIEPILVEIADTLLDRAVFNSQYPGLIEPHSYSIDATKAVMYIFFDMIMTKAYEKYQRDNTQLGDAIIEVEVLTKQLRALIKEHTDIDTHKLYKEEL